MDISSMTAAIKSLWKIIIPPSDPKESFLLLLENIASPLSWSLLFNLDAHQVTHRIRKYVLNGVTKEAWKLKDSYKDTFALEAVSAAIVAQIAITMPGLSDFGNIHWTATAFAYTSLVSGLLSTFFSFYVQQILSDLHTPEDVHEWLTSPRNNLADHLCRIILGRYISQVTGEHAANRGDRIPSLTAAATLTGPSKLLSISIISLFVALGIYLGSVYTAELGTLKGSNANLAVLLFFIIFSFWSIFEIYLPLNSKRVDQFTASLGHNEDGDFSLRNLGNSRHDTRPTTAVASTEISETGQIIREALSVSIRAQEDSLRAQKTIRQLLNTQPHLLNCQ